MCIFIIEQNIVSNICSIYIYIYINIMYGYVSYIYMYTIVYMQCVYYIYMVYCELPHNDLATILGS